MPGSPTIAISARRRVASTTRANASRRRPQLVARDRSAGGRAGAGSPARPASTPSQQEAAVGQRATRARRGARAARSARRSGSRRPRPRAPAARPRATASPITDAAPARVTTSPVPTPQRARARAAAPRPGDELRGGAQRALRVVLVRDAASPNTASTRVAAQLGRRCRRGAAQTARGGVVVALEHRAQRLGIEASARRLRELRERRRSRRRRASGGSGALPGARAAAAPGTSWRRIAASSARSSGDGSMPSPSTSAS